MLGEMVAAELRSLFRKHGFIAESESMTPVLRHARRAAIVDDITILIEGETGTGKQVLARAIHALDEKRRSFSFVTVHCSTITEALAESELFEIARLVGYRPSPGVSASAFLSFTMSNSPGAPDNVTIPAGTRVQSFPGPGQTPQVFETAQDFTAIVSSNAIPAQTTLPWSVSAGDNQTSLQGTSLNLNAGDGILFVTGQLRRSLTSGAPISIS